MEKLTDRRLADPNPQRRPVSSHAFADTRTDHGVVVEGLSCQSTEHSPPRMPPTQRTRYSVDSVAVVTSRLVRTNDPNIAETARALDDNRESEPNPETKKYSH